MINADEILLRCSSLGHVMGENGLTEKQRETIAELQAKEKLTEKQRATLAALIYKRDNPELPEMCKTHLVDLYVTNKYNRHTEIHAKQLDKGNDTEEDSITVISRITKKMLKKNSERIWNEFISGTPDLFIGETIRTAKVVRDAKSSWDVFTFNRAIHKEIIDMNYWQGMGYIALTGADVCYIDYCLNNTPYHLILGELHRESYKHEDANVPHWIEAQIIANHVYDKATFDKYLGFRNLSTSDKLVSEVYESFIEIPLEQRHFAFTIERDENEIQKIYTRVKQCRSWMNQNLFKPELLTTN